MDLHEKIMTIHIDDDLTGKIAHAVFKGLPASKSHMQLVKIGYKLGHRDARHAAAELSEKETKGLIEQVLILLNEDGLGFEALELFRKHFNIVNRYVCKNCGHITNKISIQAGCEKCGSLLWDTIVLKE